MTGRMLKWCAVAGTVLLAVAVVAWAARNQFTLTNESGQVIEILTVEVCGRAFQVENLPPGETVSGSFGTPSNESSFWVHGRLVDGTVIEDGCGYVVWEDYGQQFHIVILPGGNVACR